MLKAAYFGKVLLLAAPLESSAPSTGFHQEVVRKVVRAVDAACKTTICDGLPRLVVRPNFDAPDIALYVPAENAIVYNPSALGSWQGDEQQSLLMHEVGHFLDEHLHPLVYFRGKWAIELSADAWAGCSLANAGMSTRPFERMLAKIPGSAPFYPPDHLRRAALRDGYKRCEKKSRHARKPSRPRKKKSQGAPKDGLEHVETLVEAADLRLVSEHFVKLKRANAETKFASYTTAIFFGFRSGEPRPCSAYRSRSGLGISCSAWNFERADYRRLVARVEKRLALASSAWTKKETISHPREGRILERLSYQGLDEDGTPDGRHISITFDEDAEDDNLTEVTVRHKPVAEE